MRTLRLREGKPLAQGHRARKWPSRLHSSSQTPEPTALTTLNPHFSLLSLPSNTPIPPTTPHWEKNVEICVLLDWRAQTRKCQQLKDENGARDTHVSIFQFRLPNPKCFTGDLQPLTPMFTRMIPPDSLEFTGVFRLMIQRANMGGLGPILQRGCLVPCEGSFCLSSSWPFQGCLSQGASLGFSHSVFFSFWGSQSCGLIVFSPGGACFTMDLYYDTGVWGWGRSLKQKFSPKYSEACSRPCSPVLVTSKPFRTEFWLPGKRTSIPPPSSGKTTLHSSESLEK